jgi:sugar diacid utilization regulator
MTKESVLQSITNRFKQKGISLWSQKYENTQYICDWNGDLKVRKYINQLIESTNQDYLISEQLSVFLYKHLVIVFHDTTPPEPSEVFLYFDEHGMWLEVLAELVQKKAREQSLNFLIEESTISVIPAAETGFLFLFDEAQNKLVVKSAVGFREESYRYTRLSPNEGISGKVLHSGVATIINGEKEVAKVMSNMTERNLKYYLDSTIKAEYPYGSVSAPLRFKGKTIGVLTISTYTEDALFTQDDLTILQALADHVAVAITQADLFKKEREQRNELLMVHEALRKEHDRLQQTTNLHNNLTNIAAQGNGIPAILKALHEAVKAPVAIYDSLLSPVGDPIQTKGHHLPENFFNYSAVKRMLHTKKWQKINLNKEDVIVVIPIFGADYLLGFLCSWIKEEQLIEGNGFLLEYGATVLALEWTKLEAIRETHERVKGELIEEILTSEIMSAKLKEQARNLGLNPDAHYAVLLCHTQSSNGFGREKQKTIGKFDKLLLSHSLNGVVLQHGPYLFIILSFQEGENKQSIKLAIRKLAADLNEKILNSRIGIGRVYKGLSHLSKSYHDAERCFEILDKHQLDRKVLNFTEMGAYRFFLQHDREELESFLYDILEPLMIYEKEKSPVLLETLLQYVKHDRNLNTTISELTIHYNTLYYRIKRIQEILSLSFDETDDWFNIQLACQVYNYLRNG